MNLFNKILIFFKIERVLDLRKLPYYIFFPWPSSPTIKELQQVVDEVYPGRNYKVKKFTAINKLELVTKFYDITTDFGTTTKDIIEEKHVKDVDCIEISGLNLVTRYPNSVDYFKDGLIIFGDPVNG